MPQKPFVGAIKDRVIAFFYHSFCRRCMLRTLLTYDSLEKKDRKLSSHAVSASFQHGVFSLTTQCLQLMRIFMREMIH